MVFLFSIVPLLTLRLILLSVIGEILKKGRCQIGWFYSERAQERAVTYQYAPVPLRRGMTLQRTRSSFGEAEDPTRYSLIFEFAGTGQKKLATRRCSRGRRSRRSLQGTRTTTRQVGSARDVQDEILIFAALAHSGVDEVPLGVGVVGLVVAATKVNRLRCLEVDACWHILDLHLRSIGFLALLEIQLELGIAVADNVVGVGADEVRHLGGLEGVELGAGLWWWLGW